MKKRIVLLTLSLLLIVGMLGSGDAYAWFTSLQGGSQHVNYIKSGKIDYSLGANTFIVGNEDVYPEQNLLTGTISLVNGCDIPTSVRVKVTYAFGTEEPLTWYTWSPSNDSQLSVTWANNWVYSNRDNYVHYGGGTATSGNDGVIAAGVTVPLFTKICLSGANTDQTLAGKHVTVKVLYEARQSQYLEAWTYTS